MSEKPREDLPPHLAALSEEDLEGVIKRAEREGVPLEEVQLRARDLVTNISPEEQEKMDAMGIVERSKSAGKTIAELELRKNDDPLALAATLAQAIIKMGFAVKSTASRPLTGRFSADDLAQMIKDEKEKEAKDK